MIHTRPAHEREALRPHPAPSREDLLVFVRASAPDLRILRAFADGKRACGARFTFRGETLDAHAVASEECPDPDYAVVQRCAWLIYARMGIRSLLSESDRRSAEREILMARQRGDDARADDLARDLVLANEGMAPTRARIATQFHELGPWAKR